MQKDKYFDNNDVLHSYDIDIETSPCTNSYNYTSLDEINKIIESIDDIEKLIKVIAEFRALKGYDFFYRGLPNNNYKLLPSIVWNNVKDYSQEKIILEKAKLICKKYGCDEYKLPIFNENLFYMGICRHLGLYSKLMDWTTDIWCALSFLNIGDEEKDGVLWVLATSRKDIQPEEIDPFVDDNKIHILKENYYLPYESNDITDQPLGIFRRYRQHGYFTIHPKYSVDIPLNEITLPKGMELIKISIPSKVKKELSNCDKIIKKEKLLIDKDDPIIKEIEFLNQQYVKR